jgi:hypothetical protein
MYRWVFLWLGISSAALAQQRVEGKVVDKETGEPIPFASIGIVGTSRGTSSNLNGQFSLSVERGAVIRITCIGYESVTIQSIEQLQLIQLSPSATQLAEVVIFQRDVNARKIVRKAFANITDNYASTPFLQKFFYRHYNQDDNEYGRLIEASVDVWKEQGYRMLQAAAGVRDEIRVTQLRRSLDRTVMAQGHEPISIRYILQADVAGYQTRAKLSHLTFFTDVSNLKIDAEDYTFTFQGVTTYDGEQVYEINYVYKTDSVLTTTGYQQLPQARGTLFITVDSFAIVKAEDIKTEGPNELRSIAFYRKFDQKYYPYHLIREGVTQTADSSIHTFHIELMSVEVRPGKGEKFEGREPSKAELLKIPYDSVFWNNNTVLKTTPLEDEIISDLGGGRSLTQQFDLYQQYEYHVSDGGVKGEEKFSWLRAYSKGRQFLYVGFWNSDCFPYLVELELFKRLQKTYRKKIAFVLLSVDDDETRWRQTMTRYNLFADGIIHYRIGSRSELEREFKMKDVPHFVWIGKQGETLAAEAYPPSNPLLEREFKKQVN